MNDNVKKVFEMLGVKPMQNFQLEFKNDGYISDNYYFDNELFGYWSGSRYPGLLRDILVGEVKIIKVPKKKLRDLTIDDFKKWKKENCPGANCVYCPFHNVYCNASNTNFWVNHKDLYSDKFLDQEVDIPQEEE